PMRASFVLVIEVPFMKELELSEAIPYEARKYVPVPVNEVVLDWWPIPEGFDKQTVGETGALSGKKDLMSVLIVAIHRETIESYNQIMAACNLKVRALEIEVFSAVRALVYRELAPVMLLDIGALSSKVAIVDYGIIRLAHNLEGGSQAVTMALSRSLGIDFIRAEEMKREIGLSNRPEHREVVSVIEPVLDHTLAEAMKILQVYQRKYRRSINRVILLGGGANMEGIVEYAVKKFGIEVALADPFHRVQYPVFLRPVLQDIGPSFTQAIGLAIREL
ncbi:MAG: pilus assembly protein PilM, partial [Patescibacteria group bacterium]